MKLRSIFTIFILLLICVVALSGSEGPTDPPSGGAGGRATFAQQQTSNPPPVFITAFDDGVRTDFLAGVVLDFGVIYIVCYVQGLDVLVNVPDGQGGSITTGTVVMRSGDKSFPVTYAGPVPLFTNFQQVNVAVPRDDFPSGATIYLRVCDSAGACRNSEGATIRR